MTTSILNVSLSQLDIAARAFGWTVEPTEVLTKTGELRHVFTRGTEKVAVWTTNGEITDFNFVDQSNGNFAAVADEGAKFEALIQLSQVRA